MSGDDLRAAAQQGDWRQIKHILKNKSNPCSKDEFGLTALHYAVWNGHVECVKYLVKNTFGVDGNGVKTTSLNMQSCKGYTALHLAALDAPCWVANLITTILLVAGIDQSIRDNEGKTAIELCSEYDNRDSKAAFDEFTSRLENPSVLTSLVALEESLRKYAFPREPILGINTEEWEVNFEIPSFLMQKERIGSLPDGMKIQEHHIMPMIENGNRRYGVEAFNTLGFTEEQANVNQDRREKLLLAIDDGWAPVDIAKLQDEKKFKIGRRGKK